MLRFVLALTAMLMTTITFLHSAQADAISWSAARANDNWDFVSNNWNPGPQTYVDGDDVTFNSQAIGGATPVNIISDVAPGSITVTGQLGGTWTFSGANITGATDFTQVAGSNRPIAFSQDNLSFSGGTSLSGSGTLTFAPTSVGTANHQFGSGPITINGGNSGGFQFSPTDTVNTHTLTNNIIIGSSGGTWRNPGTGGVLGGAVTMSGELNMPNGGDFIDNPITLTTDANIRRSRTAGIVTIASNVDGGGTSSLSIDHPSGNVDWRSHIDDDNSPTAGWNILNLTKSASGSGSGTLELDVDERDFFDNMNSNGGAVVLNGGSLRFLRSNTVEVEFNLEVNNGSQGFNDNDVLNIQSTGSLSGDGEIAHQNGLSNNSGVFADPVNVNVFSGAEISPGSNQGENVGILTIDGNVVFNGGTLTIDVLGNTPGVGHDQLVAQDSTSSTGLGVVTGLENVDLVVDLTGVDGPSIQGEELVILTSTNDLTGGSFNSVSFIGGLRADVNFGNGFVSISNFQVPEPGTAALLMIGLAGFSARRRKQRAKA